MIWWSCWLLCSFSESDCTTPVNIQSRQTELNQIILHVDDGDVAGMNLTWCDRTFQPCNFSLSVAVLPCSEGYMQNHATSTGATQNALQEVCPLNAEMNAEYMNRAWLAFNTRKTLCPYARFKHWWHPSTS